VPSGLKNQRDGRGFFKRETFRIGEAIDFGTADKLRAPAVNQVAEIGEPRTVVVVAGKTSSALAAGDSRSEENLLARLDGGNASADLFDDAGDVAAGDMRERNRNAGEPAAHPEVQVVERAGVDADQNFSEAKFGWVYFGVAEDIGAAVAVEEDGFHELARKRREKYNRL